MSIEQFLENITLEELEELKKLKELKINKIPTFSFSKIKIKDFDNLVQLKEKLPTKETFEKWFNSNIVLEENIIDFLKQLINYNYLLIDKYKEEDLKVNFISPLINKINFKLLNNEIRDFYNEKISYKTDKFIFNGEVDFVISKGLRDSEIPYFFIQEFKKSEEYSNPRPQLLAELISAVELNNWYNIKGAFIVGAIWNFVILEKLGKDKYQYYVSANFDSTKIEDLKDIYKNLMFVKNEIIDMIKIK